MNKFSFFYFVILTLAFSCSKPEECEESSWAGVRRLDQGFYMKGKMNEKPWDAVSGFSGTFVDRNPATLKVDILHAAKFCALGCGNSFRRLGGVYRHAQNLVACSIHLIII